MSSANIKVLIVEDHGIARKIAFTIFTGLNCDVDTAEDGLQALELFGKNVYDLIVLDIGLPHMDGFELAKRIRASGSAAKKLPIIALTAHTDQAYQMRCVEVGMDNCYPKPLTIEIAKNIVKSHLQAERSPFVAGMLKTMASDNYY